MTFRLLLAVLAVAGLSACNAGGADGSADTSGIAEGEPLDQFAYAAGYAQGKQYLATDSSFSFDRFVEGFRAGLRGDSAEIAYAAGLQLGFDIAQDSLNVVNRDLLLAGVRAALRGDSLLVSDQRFSEVQEVFGDSLFVRQLRSQASRDDNARTQLAAVQSGAAQADSFLTAVRRQPGVQRLTDGVFYRTDTPGTGPSPKLTDRVAVRYVGSFPNGTIFDQSGDEPTVFGVNQVVPGFRDALLNMKVGETRTVYIAPEQAYGLRGQQGMGGQGGIPPNQALQFQITLVEIVPAQAMPPGPGVQQMMQGQ